MKLFLDANVLFSASNAGSNIHHFILFLKEYYNCTTCLYAFNEAERNIILKRPQWIEHFRQVMYDIALVPDAPLNKDIPLSQKDRPILGSALAAQCDYLITGDKKDFGHLYGTRIETTSIVNYTMMAEIIAGNGNLSCGTATGVNAQSI